MRHRDLPEKILGIPSGFDEDGKPIYKPLTDDQRAFIVEQMEKQVASGKTSLTSFVRRMAVRFGKNEASIWKLVRSVRDTTTLARAYFRGSAYKMAKKVVEKGSVAELMNVLSRPNIGVLDPEKKAEGQSGMFISVSMDTLGGVKIGAAIQQGTPSASLPAGDIIDTHGENESGEGPLDEFEEYVPPPPREKGKIRPISERIAGKVRKTRETVDKLAERPEVNAGPNPDGRVKGKRHRG